MEETETAEVETETRIDEHAVSMFEFLGFKGRLPDDLVEVYNDFKRVKDTIRAGRLSDEGFATVVTLYKLLK